MKKVFVFLILLTFVTLTFGIFSLLNASPGTNRDGTHEWEDPPEHLRGRSPNYTVHRRAKVLPHFRNQCRSLSIPSVLCQS